jgi:hypothetical protein
MVKISGQFLHDIPNFMSVYEDCNDAGWQPFEVHSVVIKKTRDDGRDTGSDTSAEDGADVTFSACVEDCDGRDSCALAKSKGLDLCPSTQVPEGWMES